MNTPQRRFINEAADVAHDGRDDFSNTLSSRNHWHAHRAFTLTELLVVIAIIAIPEPTEASNQGLV